MAATAPNTRPLLAKSRLLRFIAHLHSVSPTSADLSSPTSVQLPITAYTALTELKQQVLFHVAVTLIGDLTWRERLAALFSVPRPVSSTW